MGLIFTENKFKLKFWHGIVAMSILLIFIQFRSCNVDRRYEREVDKVRAYQDAIKNYNAKDGTVIDYNNSLRTTLDAFIEATRDSMRLFLDNIHIPKPDVITVYTDRFYVDSIPQVGLEIKNCEFDTTFQIIDPYYKVDGRVSNKALSLKSITIPNTSTIVIGDMKAKWWKKKQYIATVTHSNPNIRTKGISSFTFEEKQSRWSIGPYVGYGFYYDPLKGNAGHGINGGVAINYRLIGWKKK
jgi:hypothetical protein